MDILPIVCYHINAGTASTIYVSTDIEMGYEACSSGHREQETLK